MSFIRGLFQFSPKDELALSWTVRIHMAESHAQRMEENPIKRFLSQRGAQLLYKPSWRR
ncbi:MAG: hypothetical protein OJF50_003189 [Nitrospira sp.]|nr:hypothetical protein [Nitrospira sp.]